VSRRLLVRWGPLVAALAGVFYLSSLQRVPGADYFWDKLLHAAGYTTISLLTLRAFHGSLTRLRPGPTAMSFAFMLLWSLSDEYHQSFVPGRDATGGDVVADMVGFAIACALLFVWSARRKTAAEGA
jgi:VanZ family protein